MKTELADIVEKARAATPGPWTHRGRYVGVPNHMSLIGECRDVNGNWCDDKKSSPNAAHIAACNPEFILRLAEYISGLEECKSMLQSLVVSGQFSAKDTDRHQLYTEISKSDIRKADRLLKKLQAKEQP